MLHTLSPFPTRPAPSRAPDSAALQDADLLQSSNLTAPRDRLAMVSPEDWAHPLDFADNDLSRGPMLLAVVALGCTSLSVFGVLIMALAIVMGWL